MANQEHKEESDYLTRCSDACTRAGITAILTVAVALSILEPLEKYEEDLNKYESDQRDYQAQSEYLNLRRHLSETVEFFMIDPCFRFWTNAKGIRLELLTLKEISEKIDCTKVGGIEDQWLQWAVESQTNSKSIYSPAFRLPPGHLLGASQALTQEIVDAVFAVLKSHERFQDNDIIARHSLAFETFLALKLRERHQWGEKKDRPAPYTLHARHGSRDMPLYEDDLPAHLSVGGALELIDYRMPSLPKKPESPAKQSISLPQFSIPVNPITAAILSQFVLVVSLGYFLLFQREAVHVASSIYPGSGTIFSVFKQSVLTKTAFYLLCSLPVIASGFLALYVQDRPAPVEWTMRILVVLILPIAFSIAHTFWKYRPEGAARGISTKGV